ncbi:YbdK family carboxylate-amine ligase [Canibacter sp. lx-72]|uniref:carboxylate-amine ligase n=1 Tax=Canibacter zhuwentaonis TaxID=2837491 RepID=UPI001BDBDD9B|nr:YbdK family carboxylate-amine ligase [Canibacter zhuwentaonis]MBT1017753.1 YbdK family carboxylate-amine ligase [Canibacter zhuwentaonis]
MSISFKKSPQSSVGIEWELALVSKETGELVNAAPEILPQLKAQWQGNPEAIFTKELLQNTVELVTSPHPSVKSAVAQLREMAELLIRVCDEHDIAPFGGGCHPFSKWHEQKITAEPRYQEFATHHAWWGRNMLIWGVHTHVGVAKRENAVAIMNSLLTYQPYLIGISASSPFWNLENTGYVSNRTMIFQQLPSAGIPPEMHTWEEFEQTITDLRRAKVLEEINEARWDIRPAPHVGTVEVRTCDGATNLKKISATTALTQCLVESVNRKINSAETPRKLHPLVIIENKWRAARFGLEANVLTDNHGTEAPLSELLKSLCKELEPIAAELNCQSEMAYVAELAETKENNSTRQIMSYNREIAAGAQPLAALQTVVKELTQQMRDSILG